LVVAGARCSTTAATRTRDSILRQPFPKLQLFSCTPQSRACLTHLQPNSWGLP
jgi:hypothetical protein